MQRPIQIQVVATPSDAHNLSGATSDRKQEREREGGRDRERGRLSMGERCGN